MDIYKLYRNLWDFAFANPEKLKPNDIAIYSFAIEHCNRLGWKEKFGFPTSMVMEATGIKSYSVYKKHFDNLVENNFFEVIEYSRNQYSSNVIALKQNYKANDKAHIKALDKALAKHVTKHLQSTFQSTNSINKQVYNNTNEQETIDSGDKSPTRTPRLLETLKERRDKFGEELKQYLPTYGRDLCADFFIHWTEANKQGKMKFELQKTFEIQRRLLTWQKNDMEFHPDRYKPKPVEPKRVSDVEKELQNQIEQNK